MELLDFDEERLLMIVSRLEERLAELEKLKEGGNRYALERLLQLCTDESINLGSSVISGLGFKRADTYREIFGILKDEEMVSEGVSEELKKFVGLRNKLVHSYWDVNEEEIGAALRKLHVFRDYVKEVLGSLRKRGCLRTSTRS